MFKLFKLLITGSLLFGVVLLSMWGVGKYYTDNEKVVQASTPTPERSMPQSTAVPTQSVLPTQVPTVEPTPISTPDGNIYALVIEQLLADVGVSTKLPEMVGNFLGLENTEGSVYNLTIDGETWVCDFSNLENFNLDTMCHIEGSDPTEHVVEYERDTALVVAGKEIWVWNATNKSTLISVGADHGVYRCPNEVMGELDQMLNACTRIPDSEGTHGYTLGSAYD